MRKAKRFAASNGELIEPHQIPPANTPVQKSRKRSPRFALFNHPIAWILAIALFYCFGYAIYRLLTTSHPDQQCLRSLAKDKLAYITGVVPYGWLYLADASGSHSCLVTSEGRVFSAMWMPGGKRLIFTTDLSDSSDPYYAPQQVNTINADGTNQDISSAATRPDFTLASYKFCGNRMYVVDYMHDLYWTNTDDWSGDELTPSTTLYFVAPSPDCKHLAMAGYGSNFSVGVTDADSSHGHSLFVSSQNIAHVAWSPNNKSMLFTVAPDPKNPASDYGIYTAAIDGSNLYLLAKINIASDNANFTDDTVLWSPSGKEIAYLIAGNTLGIINLADPEQKNAISLDAHAIAWSSDSSTLLYTAGADSTQIYSLDVSNLQSHRLTYQGKHNTQPQWSPDGKTIAYVSETNGVSDIYFMDADGSNIRQLTTDGIKKQMIGWQPH